MSSLVNSIARFFGDLLAAREKVNAAVDSAQSTVAGQQAKGVTKGVSIEFDLR